MPPRRRKGAEYIGLPIRPFLYTLDQVAMILSLTEARLKSGYIYYDGRTPGLKPDDLLRAINIAPKDQSPDWRISQKELTVWLNFKGFVIYETGTIIG